MRTVKKILGNYYFLLVVLLMVAIWAFNENKFFSYPVKTLYILSMFYYCLKHKRLTNGFQMWSLVMICLSALSLLFLAFNDDALYTFVNLVQVFIIGYVTIGYMDDSEKIWSFLLAIVIGGGVLVLRLIITTPLSVWLTFERLGASIGYNANDVGNKAMFACLAAVMLARHGNRKLLMNVVAILFFAIVLFSGSRKDLIGALLGLAIVFTFGLENKRYLLLSLILIPLILLALYQIMMENEALYATIGRRVESMINVLFHGGEETGSIDIREALVDKAWNMVKDSNFVGVGLGQFAVLSGFDVYCHCDYLEVMCSYGLFGFLLYYAPIVYWLIRIVISRGKRKDSVSVIALGVVLLFLFVTMVMYTSAYTAILLAIIYRKSRACLEFRRKDVFSREHHSFANDFRPAFR